MPERFPDRPERNEENLKKAGLELEKEEKSEKEKISEEVIPEEKTPTEIEKEVILNSLSLETELEKDATKEFKKERNEEWEEKKDNLTITELKETVEFNESQIKNLLHYGDSFFHLSEEEGEKIEKLNINLPEETEEVYFSLNKIKDFMEKAQNYRQKAFNLIGITEEAEGVYINKQAQEGGWSSFQELKEEHERLEEEMMNLDEKLTYNKSLKKFIFDKEYRQERKQDKQKFKEVKKEYEHNEKLFHPLSYYNFSIREQIRGFNQLLDMYGQNTKYFTEKIGDKLREKFIQYIKNKQKEMAPADEFKDYDLSLWGQNFSKVKNCLTIEKSLKEVITAMEDREKWYVFDINKLKGSMVKSSISQHIIEFFKDVSFNDWEKFCADNENTLTEEIRKTVSGVITDRILETREKFDDGRLQREADSLSNSSFVFADKETMPIAVINLLNISDYYDRVMVENRAAAVFEKFKEENFDVPGIKKIVKAKEMVNSVGEFLRGEREMYTRYLLADGLLEAGSFYLKSNDPRMQVLGALSLREIDRYEGADSNRSDEVYKMFNNVYKEKNLNERVIGAIGKVALDEVWYTKNFYAKQIAFNLIKDYDRLYNVNQWKIKEAAPRMVGLFVSKNEVSNINEEEAEVLAKVLEIEPKDLIKTINLINLAINTLNVNHDYSPLEFKLYHRLAKIEDAEDFLVKLNNLGCHFRIDSTDKLLKIHENKEEFISRVKQLKNSLSDSASFNFIERDEDVYKITDSNLLEILGSFKSDKGLQNFVLNNLDKILAITSERRENYIKILDKIEHSPSQEIQKLKNQILSEIVSTDNPEISYEKIEQVFLKNNLPAVGKIYRIFETLYPAYKIKSLINYQSSPVLQKAGPTRRRHIFYQDLLKTHIRSANRSLREYAEAFLSGEGVLAKAERDGFDNLAGEEKERLKYFFGRLNTLFLSSSLGENIKAVERGLSLEDEYKRLKISLVVKEGQTVKERVEEMFLRPAGLDSLGALLDEMAEAKREAHERNMELAKNLKAGDLNLSPGDILKGVNEKFINLILQNGSVSKEFLGADTPGSDSTPFDTDVSVVLKQDVENGKNNAFKNSMAASFGNLVLAIRDRGQFQVTRRHGQELGRQQTDNGKMELFSTGGGGQHYGVRTGFPSTEIDFIIARDSFLEKGYGYNEGKVEELYYEIAQNGFYIPVTDEEGEIVFTPEMYNEYRKTFDGLDRFDGNPLEIKRLSTGDSYLQQVKEITKEMKKDRKEVVNLSDGIIKEVRRALGVLGITFKDKYDPGILGAELLDIGSTGRGTNMPGDYDFDFTLKLDDKDFESAEVIAKNIKSEMEFQEDKSHPEASGYYQLRLMGITKIGKIKLKESLDLDIGFVKKSDLAVFGSHNAIEEKLEWIKDNLGEDAYWEVLGNIVLAKKILKEGGAYKRVEQGGFGGIGTENWILANSGNLEEAFRTFRGAAYENGKIISFDEFMKKYKIFNAGMNIKHLFHDNYIKNMTESGYAAFVKTADEFLSK